MHVVAIIVCLTQCIPLRKMWDLTLTVPGTCIDTTAFFYSKYSGLTCQRYITDLSATSTLNIVTDIWIIGLPVRTLASIQRPKSEKIVLIAVFGMGVFACIASIVRLYSLRLYTQSKDPFYDAAPINIWSMVEVTVAIVCASIPSIKPLLSKSQRTKFKQSSATNGRYMKHGVGSDPAEASLRKTSPWTGSENNSIRYPESSRDNKDFELGITPTQH